MLAQGVNFVDLAGAQLLAQEAQRRRRMGGGLVLVGVQPAVREMLTRGGQLDEIGADHLVAHKGDALRAVYPLLDSEVCSSCSLRVFEECQTVLPNGELRQPPTR